MLGSQFNNNDDDDNANDQIDPPGVSFAIRAHCRLPAAQEYSTRSRLALALAYTYHLTELSRVQGVSPRQGKSSTIHTMPDIRQDLGPPF